LFNFIFPEQRVQLSGKELRNIEEQFEPRWIKEMERRMSFARGKEPVWWELFAEQFEPARLQRLERQKGIPQPFDPRYDLSRRVY